MKIRGWIVIIISLVAVLFGIIILPKAGFTANPISKVSLENLRFMAEVECLQNSQCSNNSECINNICVNKSEIDICKTISLDTSARKITIGDSINSAKRILSQSELPYLLTDGKIVELINGKLIEHLYSPSIMLGSSKIAKEDGNYLIENKEPIYTYKVAFSKGIDFSSKNIQEQVLRILGQEYVIGSNSDNSNIYLVSDKNNIPLQNKENIKITKDKDGNVIMIEIAFYPLESITAGSNFIDTIFSSTKLSFNSADDSSADVRFGGNC